MTHKTVSPALHALTILLLSSVTALAQTSTDEAYLERRNDQGIVAYCSDQGFLEPDSEEFFHVGTVEILAKSNPRLKLIYTNKRVAMAFRTFKVTNSLLKTLLRQTMSM
ncbi:hypothetical protein HED51_20505 [Ochrobactrum grignonense]|nr:hypothetical protein [Brucella grignonensis]